MLAAKGAALAVRLDGTAAAPRTPGRRRYFCFDLFPALTRFMMAERCSSGISAHRALPPAPAAARPPFLPRRRR